MIDIPQRYEDILQSTALAYVATVGPTGAPQVSPVWFVWDGQRLFYSTTRARQKFRNVQREARVSVAITDVANPFRSLEIRGSAHSSDDTDLRGAHRVWRKYMQSEPTPDRFPSHEERVVTTITPEQLLVFEP